MSQSTEVTVAQPTLPGMLPNEEVRALVGSFLLGWESTIPVISRLPTVLERATLTRRREELIYALRPAEDNPQEKIALKGALNLWLAGYTSLVNADQAGLSAAYVATLKRKPLWAVQKAIDAVKDRTARFSDGRGGFLTPDTTWAPSAYQMAELCDRYVETPKKEETKINGILAARKEMPKAVSEEERQAVGAGMSEFAERLKGAQRSADEIEKAQAVIARRTSKLIERGILAEYAEAGLQPVRLSGGQLVCLEGARKLGKELKATDKNG